jgi:hypothetical protein
MAATIDNDNHFQFVFSVGFSLLQFVGTRNWMVLETNSCYVGKNLNIIYIFVYAQTLSREFSDCTKKYRLLFQNCVKVNFAVVEHVCSEK